jgi:hypothetical protein
MLTGSAQQFTAVDELGRPRPDAAWTVSNTSLATISTDTSPILTAVAPGQVTLTAAIGNVTAQAQVTILTGTSFPVGTALWSAPTIAGFTTQQIVQAVPTSANTPDLFALDEDANQNLLVRSFTGDGQQLWQVLLPASQINATEIPGLTQAMGDRYGGLFLFGLAQDNSEMTMLDLDGQTGGVVWQFSEPFIYSQGAIGSDGGIYSMNYGFGVPSVTLVRFDPNSGQQTQIASLPNGSETSVCGSAVSSDFRLALATNPLIDGNGNIFTEYAVSGLLQVDCSPASTSNTQTGAVLKVAPNGSTSTANLYSYSKSCNGPGDCPIDSYSLTGFVPDGQGGVLAGWSVISAASGVTSYNITNTSSSSTYPSPSAGYLTGNIVLGEDGNVFLTDGSTVFVSDPNSGAVHWTYQPSQGVNSIFAVHGGGVSIFDNQMNQTTVDSSGNAGSPLSFAFSSIQPSVLGTLNGIAPTGNLALISAPVIDFADGGWDAAFGSLQKSGASEPLPYLAPLPSCPGAQTPCAGDALENAFSSLQTLVSGNCANCQTFVFSKSQLGITQQSFSTYLNRGHSFYNATRSNATVGKVLCRSIIYTCNVTASQFNMTITQFWQSVEQPEAITKTPSSSGQGLVTFWDPSQVKAALGNTVGAQANQAAIFHEGLHGLTGTIDNNAFHAVTNLEDIFGICYEPSVAITEYITFNIFGLGTPPTTQQSSIGPCTSWP